jgi:hypothetical protein
MLPHAVDDRGQIIGQFWTGTIDHGCTAWVGKMMYDYWSFGGAGDDYAEQVVLPFLHGAMRVYEEMLEPDGAGMVLPVSVSPEYRGAALNAWGRNASFQLACIHWLCEKLIELTKRFNRPQRTIWQTILNQLPKATVSKKIDLWQGTGLEESHRHHSHLAGIVPFDIFDVNDPSWTPIIRASIRDWVMHGTGLWSGWAMPWAAQLHTRMGHADMAELTLETWQRVFTNVGHGTLHDCRFPGFTLLGDGASAARGRTAEIMQMDAGMGVVQAITDLLLHERRGVHHLFAGCPESWGEVSFTNLRTAGGFLIAAARSAGVVRRLTIRATRDGTFRVMLPASGEVKDFRLTAGAEAVPISL